ncbi:hypothetical protein CAPTEDRAFT_207815, partial [Capitella teleta]
MGQEKLFPESKPKQNKPEKSTILLMVVNQHGEVLLERRPPTGIWGGLWSFPEISDPEQITEEALKKTGLLLNGYDIWQSFRHTFSHYHLDITPALSFAEYPGQNTNWVIKDSDTYCWFALNQSFELGLAAPVKKLLQKVGHILYAEIKTEDFGNASSINTNVQNKPLTQPENSTRGQTNESFTQHHWPPEQTKSISSSHAETIPEQITITPTSKGDNLQNIQLSSGSASKPTTLINHGAIRGGFSKPTQRQDTLIQAYGDHIEIHNEALGEIHTASSPDQPVPNTGVHIA